MKSTIFWGITPYSPLKVNRNFITSAVRTSNPTYEEDVLKYFQKSTGAADVILIAISLFNVAKCYYHSFPKNFNRMAIFQFDLL
jgi:hypothetical protein